MRPLFLLALVPSLLPAQVSDERGAQIFRTSCAVGYCHGSAGHPGRAPALAGRKLDPAHVLKVTSDGLPGTGMPGWKGRFSPAELEAVVAYVNKISGSATPAGAVPAATTTAAAAMPAAAARGKQLFFDAVRGYRCGTCHAVEGSGTPAGPNLAALPAGYDFSFRRGSAGSVRRASLAGGDSFPALVVEEIDSFLKLYDLTTPPPVLRTVPSGSVRLAAESQWRHAKAVQNYSDEELQTIAGYLRWLSTR